MALHQTRKCDKFNLKFLDSILAGTVQFVRKETHSNNVIPCKTSQIIGIFYTQIGAHKSAKKATFALSDFVLLLVCHIGMLVLNKNAKKTFVAICFGFREKIASLTGLLVSLTSCFFLCTCIKSARQYVGETKWEIRYRITEHQRDTHLIRDTPVANHYNESGHLSENMLF